VRVVPDVPGLDKEFDYSVPASMDADVRVGTLVRISLHGRRVGGWVVADDVEPPAGVEVRAIAKVTGWGPDAGLIAVARWAAWRWAGALPVILRTASPPSAVRGLPPPAAPATAPQGPPDALAEEALAAKRTVLRLPPAADPFAVILAAVRRGPALVLAPSVGEAGLVALRLKRAGVITALMPREWARAAAGGATVVGARAGAWAPVPGLAAVVVLDAHEEVFQEERTPTWNAWQVAAERARRGDVPCVVVSACPTLEQLAWGRLLEPPRAVERSGWPVVDVVDPRRDDPRIGLYSPRLVDALRRPGRVICVLNRKGRARLLACQHCTELARCERCAAAVQQSDDGLVCRRCATTRPSLCAACGSQRLKTLRVGVTRAREELEALAGEPVGEVTAETEELPTTRILVGTEAVLRRVDTADTVAFLELDQELLAPRYRAGEQAMALLARAARLVGGRAGGGRLLLQTRLPKHEVVDAVLHADPGRLAAVERERRAVLRFPPVTALALVSGAPAAEFVAAAPATLDRLGPDDGRWLLRAPDHRELCDGLAATPRPAGRLRVEVDPIRV
jgi:primosomal protein N' (replication factor Y)